MQSIKINLSETQASFMLPLLDELHIDYTQEYEISDEEQSRLKETLERYKMANLNLSLRLNCNPKWLNIDKI